MAKRKPRPVDALPKFIAPQLTQLVEEPPAGPVWAHELKYDGYRIPESAGCLFGSRGWRGSSLSTDTTTVTGGHLHLVSNRRILSRRERRHAPAGLDTHAARSCGR